MKNKLKYIYLGLMFAFFILSLYGLIIMSYLLSLFNETKVTLSGSLWVLFIFPILFGLVGIIYFAFTLRMMIKKSNLLNFTKYTYEEFKAIMDKKKAEKQEKKKQKLQQQLNDLENTD